MKNIITRIAKRLFGAEVEFRAKLLYVIMIVGIITCVPTAFVNLFGPGGVAAAVVCFALAGVMIPLLWYVVKSGNINAGYIGVILALVFGFVPGIFFTCGGYKGSSPLSFAFTIVLTAFALRGKQMIILSAAQFVFYIALMIFAYYYPHTITPLQTDADFVFENTFSLLMCFVPIVVIFALHFRIYDRDRRELIAARDRIAELSRLHHGVFTQMSHEMRTPLTVMSASAQYAVKQIERGTMDVNTVSDLKSISGEAKRLSELADNALNALAGGSGKNDSPIIMSSVDVVSLCQNVISLMNHIPQSQRPNITLDAPDNIGEVQGDNRLLTQLVYNFLANAATHSGCTGMGLHLCQEIADKHGAKISVDSEVGKGTKMSVRLRG